jgi:hypothetical protein
MPVNWRKLKHLMSRREIKYMERFERLALAVSVTQKAADKAWSKYKVMTTKDGFPKCLQDEYDRLRKERVTTK